MIITRYIARETLQTSFAVTMALTFMFVSARFVKYLAQAASGYMSGDIVWSVLLYRLPGFLELIFPLGFFLAILLTYGRLYVESEMIVLHACGMSKQRLLRITLWPATLMIFLVGSLSLYFTPIGLYEFNKIWGNPQYFSGIGTLMPGQFQDLNKGRFVSYTESVGNNRSSMSNVFLSGQSEQSGSGDILVVWAREGRVITEQGSGKQIVELLDGVQYEGQPGKANYRITQFKRFGQRIETEQDVTLPPPVADAKPSLELIGSDKPREQAAWQWRLSLPLMIPLIALIAVALSETNHRRGRFLKLLPGILLYLSYVVLLSISRGALEKGKIPPEVGLWWVHIVYLMVGLLLLFGNPRRLYLRWRAQRRYKQEPSL